jgi:hypothetical protein
VAPSEIREAQLEKKNDWHSKRLFESSRETEQLVALDPDANMAGTQARCVEEFDLSDSSSTCNRNCAKKMGAGFLKP